MPQFIRETPYENPLTGLSNDVIQGLLGYMKDKQRTQQMQGLASLLESTGIPKTVERAAYAESPTGLLNALTNVNRANVPLLKSETADALMTLSPVPSGTNKAAMAVGRAGERYAEKVVPQIMERGGLPAEMVQAMGTNTRSLLDVYHGTPHKFAPTERNPLGEFDVSKIGTGEGAQVYGHGLYLGEARGTGEEYRKALTGNHNGDKFITTIDGNPTDSFVAKAIIREGGNPEPFIAKMQSKLKKQINGLEKVSKDDDLGLGITDYDMALMDVSKTQKIIDEASSYIGKTIKNEQPGYLYKVDLPDEQIAKMLDYDKTWKQQPKNVQDAINVDNLLKYYGTDDISTSQVLYHAKQNMSPAAFAEFLRSKGVPGIKYLDEGSRAEGQGTRNFVVFPGEEKSMTILERNGLLADQFQALPEEKKREVLSLLE